VVQYECRLDVVDVVDVVEGPFAVSSLRAHVRSTLGCAPLAQSVAVFGV
jgi:predicted ATP-dependent protease